MPTVLKIGPYRFHFYSDEGSEPPHIHVRRDSFECKFWLEPIGLAKNNGIPVSQIYDIEKLVYEKKELIMEAWNEYFSN